MSLGSPRRVYLAKRQVAARAGDQVFADVWQAKQLEQPGTALPDGFPLRARLAAAGYVAVEDLLGANDEELQQAGFTRGEAAAVLAAL